MYRLTATQELIKELCKRFHMNYGDDLKYLVGKPVGDVIEEIRYLSWHPEVRVAN